MEKCTEFIRICMPGTNDEEMVVPSDFVKDVKQALPNTVVLKDQYGNLWKVNMEKIGNVWYLKNGWKKFFTDCCFEWGDVLRFKYVGGGVFYVTIFGNNSCEKKRTRNSTVAMEEASNPCKKSRAEEEQEEADGNEYAEDKDENEEDVVVISDDEEDVVVISEAEDDVQGDQVTEAEVVANQSTQSKRRKITDWFATDLFMSGVARQPTNPYFVTTVKPCRDDELFIPKFVYKISRLELPRTIVLVDEQEIKYSMKRKDWTDGRIHYIGGWRDICRSNSVNPDDRCIFEFIEEEKEEGKKLHIRFSVIRASVIRANGGR